MRKPQPGDSHSSRSVPRRRLLAGIALAVLPWFAACQPRAPFATPKWKVKIGPHACDLKDQNGGAAGQLVVSKSARDTIEWHSHAAGRHIYLVFHVPQSAQQPFSGMADLQEKDADGNELFALGGDAQDDISSGPVDSGETWLCSGSDCDSVSDPAHPRPGQIKYDQYLKYPKGIFVVCDGWIIIKP